MINPAETITFAITPVARGFAVDWNVPENLPYFEGHFPGNPVLPAVAILDATLQVLRAGLAQSELELFSVPNAKFMGIIRPGSRVHIEVYRDENGSDPAEWRAEWTGEEPGTRLAELRIRTRFGG
jgi:3-hydroxymyristoyl/3-hydroxydecanoyl-(acyl carrier protein) dehydratase